MKFAYADPPYLGYGKFYDEHHEQSRQYDSLSAHVALLEQLTTEFSDGWALSMTSGNLLELGDLIRRIAPTARIAAWVKPFASFKPGVSPAYTWEPIVFVNTKKHPKDEPTVRDHFAANITLGRGLVGAKPESVCSWILDLLGWTADDELVDLFPGTGVMDRVVAARAGVHVEGQLALFAS